MDNMTDDEEAPALSPGQARDAGINPAHYDLSLTKHVLTEGAYPGRLDGLVWREREPWGLQALVTLDDGRKALAVSYWRNGKSGPKYDGFRQFWPGHAVQLVIGIGPKGGRKVRLAAPSSAEGDKAKAAPSWTILRMTDADGQKAFVQHPDGFCMSPRDLAQVIKRAWSWRVKPVAVFVINNVPADRRGMLPVRQVVSDEYGLMFLDREEQLVPKVLFERD